MRLLERMRLVKGKGLRKGFRRDESAVTAIEFAMVAPLFFLMLGIILETGMMMFTEYVLQTSVQEAARIVRTGQAQEGKMTAATFKTQICKLAGIIIDCNGKVTVYMRAETNFSTLTANVPSFLTIGPKDDGTSDPVTFQCGAPSQAVALIATYDWEFVIPYFMKFFGNRNADQTRRMAGFAMFKNEPFPAVAGNTCA